MKRASDFVSKGAIEPHFSLEVIYAWGNKTIFWINDRMTVHIVAYARVEQSPRAAAQGKIKQ